jgi:hypothetical protein
MYIRNRDLHRDLGIETLTDIITRLASSIKRDFKSTSTVKCPDFSMCTISPDDSNGRNRLN